MSDQWCTVAIDHTTETEPTERGMFSAVPLTYRTFSDPRVRSRAVRNMTGAGSTPVTVAPNLAA
jgi:hypothetical protein